MAIRKFLTSVADVYGYDQSDTLLFTGKTLLDSSIEVSLGSAPVRGGRGNQLQYIYYHTGEMKITLTDTQWNLAMIGATVGAAVTPSNSVYAEETVAVTGSAGSVSQTPLAFTTGGVIYGWATSPLGVTQKIIIAVGKTFTVTGVETSGNWCVRYYTANAASTSVTVSANMIPSIVKLVMETQLNSADITTNKIGIVQIIVPTATLSGAFTIAMKSDGVSNTPLSATALAYNGEPGSDACATTPYYARIIEIIDSAEWYDNVTGLSVIGGDFNLVHQTTTTLNVWAVPSYGAAFKAPLGGELDFSISTTTGTTVDASTGVVTALTTTGVGTINVHIHDVTTTDTTAIVTIT